MVSAHVRRTANGRAGLADRGSSVSVGDGDGVSRGASFVCAVARGVERGGVAVVVVGVGHGSGRVGVGRVRSLYRSLQLLLMRTVLLCRERVSLVLCC